MQNKTIFYVLVSLLIIVGSWWLGVNVFKNGKQVRQQKMELAEYQEKFQQLSEVTESYSVVKERHRVQMSKFDSLKSIIPDRDSFIAVLEEIRRLTRQQNVEVKSLSPVLEDSYPSIKTKLKFTNKHIERYPVKLNITGKFLTIGAFLEELLSMPTIVNVGRISVETELESGIGLSCDLVLYAYMFVDEVKDSL